MKFFIDTANVEDIKKANDMGVICGVTTNPSLIAKEGRDFNEVIKEITSIVDGPISGEVKATTEDAQGMIAAIHTIAFSMGKASAVDVAEQNLPAMLEELLFAPLNPGELWNVNFPPCPAAECKGVLRGRFPEKHSFYENYYTCLREENGVQYLTPVPKVLTREETQEGSDIHAVLNGYISIGKVRCAAY